MNNKEFESHIYSAIQRIKQFDHLSIDSIPKLSSLLSNDNFEIIYDEHYEDERITEEFINSNMVFLHETCGYFSFGKAVSSFYQISYTYNNQISEHYICILVEFNNHSRINKVTINICNETGFKNNVFGLINHYKNECYSLMKEVHLDLDTDISDKITTKEGLPEKQSESLYSVLKRSESVQINDLFFRYFNLNNIDSDSEYLLKVSTYDDGNLCGYQFTVDDIKNSKYDSYENGWMIGMNIIQPYAPLQRMEPEDLVYVDIIEKLDFLSTDLWNTIRNNEEDINLKTMEDKYNSLQDILKRQALTIPF